MTSPHQPARCGVSPQQLHRAFDKEAGETGAGQGLAIGQDVAGHVTSCDPCGTALGVLESQRDAVHYLSQPITYGERSTVLEQVLTISARVGREKLADLLYEMAKACLQMVPDLRKRVHMRTQPRLLGSVSSDLSVLASRGALEVGEEVSELTSNGVSDSASLAVARRSLTVLGNVEGSSERQQLGIAQLLNFEHKPEQAEAVLRSLLERQVPQVYRDSAERNLMLSLIRQHKFSEAVDLGEEVHRRRPDDEVVLYNMAASFAWLEDRGGFERFSGLVAQSLSRSQAGWLSELVHYEIPNFADALSTSPEYVKACFGLGGSRGKAD